MKKSEYDLFFLTLKLTVLAVIFLKLTGRLP
jgi:hypothetical protein